MNEPVDHGQIQRPEVDRLGLAVERLVGVTEEAATCVDGFDPAKASPTSR
ncbi:MAG: hypothetical protein U5K30_02620 [Acidimicrobiales bacterium]|nr:hypothetical protein [Acidimicrobiales bacterium]